MLGARRDRGFDVRLRRGAARDGGGDFTLLRRVVDGGLHGFDEGERGLELLLGVLELGGEQAGRGDGGRLGGVGRFELCLQAGDFGARFGLCGG